MAELKVRYERITYTGPQMSTKSGPHSPDQEARGGCALGNPSSSHLDQQICVAISIGDWSFSLCAHLADECAIELSVYEAALTMPVLTVYCLFCQTALPVRSCLLNHIPQLLHW